MLPDARAVESAALRVEEKSMRLTSELQETVRVAAGQTSAAVLAQGLHLMKSGPAIEIVVTDAISPNDTRAPDIFIDHGLPSDATGVTRRVGSINSAVYGAPAFGTTRALPLSSNELAMLPWLGFVVEQEHYITMKWLAETMRERPPAARMVNTDLMAAAAANGVGIAVLPCFKGDQDPRLVRLSERIDVLREDYWTVIQSDLAKNPSVRTALNWIIDCFGVIELPEL
ncbi:Transcriptional regulator (plasmid) [Phaeobacter gallaeciensis]|uniref:Transcriptional regulator n=2 Tax=Phaeobacter gallaeciensis TaxID=60890 RepID=A0AAC9ZCY9_9RHOB|nr:Transcriptional regulator [Phaeobacter gallaeciensis DSM 26640]ATE94809.1 Transcriptional regulator [Phaeobacter gallaeciensis]ATE99081.1 Transcriptional regulator [Phaeobacter gallaeciensis]ATF03473.1 Transcriptional regulator [Phaeobacter gallaeciensis]ATF07853.1 Transcriptional regulator [Phaeobacter gallaeciensis]